MRKWMWFGLFGTAVAVSQGLAQQPLTIQYWNINTEAFGGPAVKELIANFERQNPGIKVEARSQQGYTGLLQNVQAAIAAGTPPEVAQVGYLYTNYVAENLPYQDIRKLAAQYNDKHLDVFAKNVLELGRVGENLVGMPYSLSSPLGYVNMDLARKAGVDFANLPRTWEGWRKFAPEFKAKTGKYALSIGYNDDNWSIEGLVASNGGSLLTCQNGEYRANFDSREGVQALTTWSGMIQQGVLLNANYQQAEQAFLAGETLMHITTIASRANYQKNAKFELRGLPYPRFGSKPAQLPGGGNVLSVFAKDPARLEAAWKFVKYLTGPEGITVWTKGTGYVPIRSNLAYDNRYLKPFIAENPIQQIAVTQLKSTIRWTTMPGANGLAAGQALFKAVQQSHSGQASPADALKAAAAEVNKQIAGEKCKQ